MIAEIISVGNELLQGSIDDTNQTHISRLLTAAGVIPQFRSTVGDSRADVISALRNAAARADAVIVTGGLGPTPDDITIEAAAEAFGLELETHVETENRVKKFFDMIGVPCTPNALRQARVPRGAAVIKNNMGTAPGVKLSIDDKLFFFMPGVPREMKGMIGEVISSLPSGADCIVSRSIRVFGVGESNLEAMLPERIIKADNPVFSFLPHRFEVELRLTARGADAAACDALLSPAVDEIYRLAGQYIYGEGDDTLESIAVARLKARGLKVAFAESCTGGLVGARLTAVPGASDVFAGTIVAYNVEMKHRLLDVPEDLLAEHGPVSEQAAKSMAEGVLARLGADIGVSVTGNAGPSSNDEKSSVGQIYIALAARARPGGTLCMGRRIMRSRNDVRDIAASAALDLLGRNI